MDFTAAFDGYISALYFGFGAIITITALFIYFMLEDRRTGKSVRNTFIGLLSIIIALGAIQAPQIIQQYRETFSALDDGIREQKELSKMIMSINISLRLVKENSDISDYEKYEIIKSLFLENYTVGDVNIQDEYYFCVSSIGEFVIFREFKDIKGKSIEPEYMIDHCMVLMNSMLERKAMLREQVISHPQVRERLEEMDRERKNPAPKG